MDARIAVVEHQHGLVTQGISPALDALCASAHERFLQAHTLAYWQLVVMQVYGTPYVVLFSRASGRDQAPSYKLGDTNNLPAQIEELLHVHHEQWTARAVPAASN